MAVAAVAGLAGGLGSALAATPDGFRRLTSGVLTVIPADTSADDTMQRGDILEITRGRTDRTWTPKRDAIGGTLVEQAKNRTYPRDVWCLEFAFKPPRLIDDDLPVADLKMKRKRLWYLLYRVKNVGVRRTVASKDNPNQFTRETFEAPIRFLPHFVLESIEGLSKAEGAVDYRGYLDRMVPPAIEPIRSREGITERLHDSASMVETEIAPGEERWGVAVWEDVDPRIDYFSIFVRGLTNAIRWRLNENAAFAADDPPGVGTDHALESLRLDFWRPGDEHDAIEGEVRIGHAGLLERMAIGVRVLEALGRPIRSGLRRGTRRWPAPASRPTASLPGRSRALPRSWVGSEKSPVPASASSRRSRSSALPPGGWTRSCGNWRRPGRSPCSTTFPSTARGWPQGAPAGHSMPSMTWWNRNPMPANGPACSTACWAPKAPCSTPQPPPCTRALTTPGFSVTKLMQQPSTNPPSGSRRHGT
ncbi:MAG: hypothetical protein WCJ18_04780 [Planctomycetota bacterium]